MKKAPTPEITVHFAESGKTLEEILREIVKEMVYSQTK